MDEDAGHSAATSLRSAHDADWPMIRRWLALSEVEQLWGPKATSEAAVMLAMSSDHAICRIIEVGETAVGYAHAIDATLWGENLPEALEPGTWDIDLFIAAPAYRGQGVGVRALQLLRDEVFSSTLAVAVCVSAAVANERLVRAYEKAGFRWKGVWNESGAAPAWFMTAERPTN